MKKLFGVSYYIRLYWKALDGGDVPLDLECAKRGSLIEKLRRQTIRSITA
jgi:hypothetical protein